MFTSSLKSLNVSLLVIILITSISIQGSFAYSKGDTKSEINQINQTSTDGRYEGYNLFVIIRFDGNTWRPINRSLVITDLSGNVYFAKDIPTYSGSLNDAEFINSTTILYGDDGGANLWNLETDTTRCLNFDGHHEYERNYANDTYFSISEEPIKIEGASYMFDRVFEYNEFGEAVWNVSTSSFISHTQWCPYQDLTGIHRDLTHTNTVQYDDREDMIYLNVRNVNTFYKLDHKTGEVIWGLGEYGNFTLFDIYGNERDALFYHSHGLEKISDNKFIMFDNDEHNQTDAANHHSRLLEITIDEDKMYANVTWEWISPTDYYSGWYGDCDLLPNNNYLGVFGSQTRPGTDYGARLVEVNPEGEIVWEYSYERAGFNTFGVYRMERFRFEPIVSEPTFHNLGENDSYVEWDVWYNYRSRTEFQGQYFITIDDNLTENGTIELQRFWQSTNVRLNISPTSYLEHEVSLVISDEAGHLSNETDRYEPIGALSPENTGRIGIPIIFTGGLLIPTLGVGAYVICRKHNKKPLFKYPIFKKNKS